MIVNSVFAAAAASHASEAVVDIQRNDVTLNHKGAHCMKLALAVCSSCERGYDYVL